MKNITRNKLILPVFIVLWLLIFAMLSWYIVNISKQNQAYNRYTSCVLSVPALERNGPRIERCYDEAFNDTGVKVKRYDVDKSKE